MCRYVPSTQVRQVEDELQVLHGKIQGEHDEEEV